MPPLREAGVGAAAPAGDSVGPGRAGRLARRLFLGAGVYGLITLLPQYFMAPPSLGSVAALTHYGFVGVALVWQLGFMLIASDVARYRRFMLPAVVEKLAFGVPAAVLCLQGRAVRPWPWQVRWICCSPRCSRWRLPPRAPSGHDVGWRESARPAARSCANGLGRTMACRCRELQMRGSGSASL